MFEYTENPNDHRSLISEVLLTDAVKFLKHFCNDIIRLSNITSPENAS